tara:strand:- start:1694 stop:2137 length:444 start_codon:yes stop_codon:yes gene_type:complete
VTNLFLLISLLVPTLAPPKVEAVKPPKIPTIKEASLDEVFKYCPVLSESYSMPKTIYDPGPAVHLIKLDNCLETKSLLVVSWVGKSRNLERIFTELVVTHYALFVAEKTKEKTTVEYVNTKSQKPVDPRLPADFEGMANFAFYILKN